MPRDRAHVYRTPQGWAVHISRQGPWGWSLLYRRYFYGPMAEHLARRHASWHLDRVNQGEAAKA